MRLCDFDQIDEAAAEEHREDVEQYLAAQGFKQIGDGADSMVYAKDDVSVTKIIFPLAVEDMDRSVKTFLHFYEFCKRTNSPYLPRFSRVNQIKVAGEKFYAIVMERLYPIEEDSYDEAIVWLLSDCAQKSYTWEQAQEEVANPGAWRYYTGTYNIEQLVDHPLRESNWRGFYETMLQTRKAMPRDRYWDLHTANVMVRRDGTLVIVDPWVH